MSWWHDGKVEKDESERKAAFRPDDEPVKSTSKGKYECKRGKGKHVFEEVFGKRRFSNFIVFPYKSALGGYTWRLFVCKNCGKEKSTYKK